MYALFANTIGSSAMFAWDVQASHFELVWSGAPALSLVPITIPQVAGQMNLVAIADKNITANAVLYQLIKVKDSDYAPRYGPCYISRRAMLCLYTLSYKENIRLKII